MSDLSSIERLKLERLFGIESGYVLDFSNNSFSTFMLENSGVEIYSDKYFHATSSKANRLRAFWQEEPNHVVGRVISDLLDYWKTQRELEGVGISPGEQSLYEVCLKIAERLNLGGPLEYMENIRPIANDRNFTLLTKSIKDSIRNNEPEFALDRLHTLVVKFVRQLCDKHGIGYAEKTPLHGVFGQYVKHLRRNELIDSAMTERILKASISILEAFNDVRNRRSLAHDNPILNYHESMLIYNHVLSIIRFLQAIEGDESEQPDELGEIDRQDEWDDIPF